MYSITLLYIYNNEYLCEEAFERDDTVTRLGIHNNDKKTVSTYNIV